MEIVSSVDGWKGELRTAASSASQATIATLDGSANQIITLREPISAGLIWFTKLTEITNGRYGVELRRSASTSSRLNARATAGKRPAWRAAGVAWQQPPRLGGQPAWRVNSL